MKILVTGSAGFIGSTLSQRLLERGDEVIGFDNLNDYYDVNLKRARLARLQRHPGFTEVRANLEDRPALTEAFVRHRPQRVVNLAAQAGVRYSIQNPHAYVDSNLVGFVNLLEACRHHEVEHLVYASTSSVYGANTRMPFSVHDNVDHPLSLYAATKKANELMAHTYSHLYRLPTTGLRFFTVYGPWGRPDMAPLLFSRAALKGEPIRVFNHGRMRRDFTHISDIVTGVLGALDNPPELTGEQAPVRVFNLGNHTPVELGHFIDIIEQAAGKSIDRHFEAMQPGDMVETMASTEAAHQAFGFEPRTRLEDGLPPVVAWCRDYFGDGVEETAERSIA